MQVYRDLRILSARPTEEAKAGIRHELYGFVGASDQYSVGRYVADARLHIETAQQSGEVAIIVGGTGLYFRSLLEGLSPVPPIDPDIRTRWREVAENLGPAHLVEALRLRDPVMAERLAPTDSQRLVRALEVIDSTGRSLSYWQQIPGEPIVGGEDVIKVVASVEREELYARCDARFDAMMDEGALFEVARLQAMQLDRSLPIFGALGVRPLMAHLDGHAGLVEALTQAKRETRHYAKRQLTWLRRNMIAWQSVKSTQMKRNDLVNIILGD